MVQQQRNRRESQRTAGNALDGSSTSGLHRGPNDDTHANNESETVDLAGSSTSSARRDGRVSLVVVLGRSCSHSSVQTPDMEALSSRPIGSLPQRRYGRRAGKRGRARPSASPSSALQHPILEDPADFPLIDDSEYVHASQSGNCTIA